MKLNTHFGATDAHKLINAVMDKLAAELRTVEVEADKGTGYKQKKQQAKADQLSTVQAEEAVVEQDNAEQASTEAPKTVETDQQPRQPKNHELDLNQKNSRTEVWAY